jgi:deazaflavin-dependent oxidoreductase (nitroreductase family)
MSVATSAAGNRVWRVAFRALFLVAPERLMTYLARNVSSVPYVEVYVVGRRTGVQRRTLLTLLEVDGNWYIGHPNGGCDWSRNLRHAGSAVVVRGGHAVPVTSVLLEAGAERMAVIRATTRQPFPANALYRVARRHVYAAGTYFRLKPRSE